MLRWRQHRRRRRWNRQFRKPRRNRRSGEAGSVSRPHHNPADSEAEASGSPLRPNSPHSGRTHRRLGALILPRSEEAGSANRRRNRRRINRLLNRVLVEAASGSHSNRKLPMCPEHLAHSAPRHSEDSRKAASVVGNRCSKVDSVEEGQWDRCRRTCSGGSCC